MTFDFSYEFGNGFKVTGSLEGIQNGEFIENVSNVLLFFNGTPVAGPIYTGMLDSSINWVPGAVVSFDVSKNNFIFVNGSLASTSYSAYFEIISSPPYTRSLASAYNGGNYLEESPSVTSSWSLTPAIIPESSTYLAAALLLLPFGASTIRFIRKTRTA
jgi:hypothetical protein